MRTLSMPSSKGASQYKKENKTKNILNMKYSPYGHFKKTKIRFQNSQNYIKKVYKMIADDE